MNWKKCKIILDLKIPDLTNIFMCSKEDDGKKIYIIIYHVSWVKIMVPLHTIKNRSL
jgi:hypothetical protein